MRKIINITIEYDEKEMDGEIARNSLQDLLSEWSWIKDFKIV